MSQDQTMDVIIRLPSRILFQGRVSRLRAEGKSGSFGLLPKHTDFVAELVPSVLMLVLQNGEEVFFGIDEGLLVKRDHEVSAIVRRGVAGDELDSLHQKVHDSFMLIEDEERVARAALSRIEASMVRRLGQLKRMQP